MTEGLRISAAGAKGQVDAGGVWDQLAVAVPGAVRIPPDQDADRVGALPRERTVVAYCT